MQKLFSVYYYLQLVWLSVTKLKSIYTIHNDHRDINCTQNRDSTNTPTVALTYHLLAVMAN